MIKKQIFKIAPILVLLMVVSCSKKAATATIEDITIAADLKTATVTLSSAITNTPGSRYWVNLVPAESKDSTWGDWKYVPNNATTVTITLKKAYKPGKYQSRLHDSYPKKQYHVIARKEISIK